jgi:hypothetical protein
MLLKSQVFLSVIPCRLVNTDRSFEGSALLHLLDSGSYCRFQLVFRVSLLTNTNCFSFERLWHFPVFVGYIRRPFFCLAAKRKCQKIRSSSEELSCNHTKTKGLAVVVGTIVDGSMFQCSSVYHLSWLKL